MEAKKDKKIFLLSGAVSALAVRRYSGHKQLYPGGKNFFAGMVVVRSKTIVYGTVYGAHSRPLAAIRSSQRLIGRAFILFVCTAR